MVVMLHLSIQGRVVVGMHHLFQQREVAIGWCTSFIVAKVGVSLVGVHQGCDWLVCIIEYREWRFVFTSHYMAWDVLIA